MSLEGAHTFFMFFTAASEKDSGAFLAIFLSTVKNMKKV
jgi:hypothetical protein